MHFIRKCVPADLLMLKIKLKGEIVVLDKGLQTYVA